VVVALAGVRRFCRGAASGSVAACGVAARGVCSGGQAGGGPRRAAGRSPGHAVGGVRRGCREPHQAAAPGRLRRPHVATIAGGRTGGRWGRVSSLCVINTKPSSTDETYGVPGLTCYALGTEAVTAGRADGPSSFEATRVWSFLDRAAVTS